MIAALRLQKPLYHFPLCFHINNIPRILSIQRLNRLQNKIDLLFADVNSGGARVVLSDKDPCWVDVQDDLTFQSRHCPRAGVGFSVLRTAAIIGFPAATPICICTR